jgi:hypothetical protein
MKHFVERQNLGLITTRMTKEKWDVLCTKRICAHKSCAAYDGNFVFPLYLYEAKQGTQIRHPNFNDKFIKSIFDKLTLKYIDDGRGDLKSTFGPEDLFNYIYAILHSPAYRTRYSEFLKMDFPRIPITNNRELFTRLAELGARLVWYHLLEADELRVLTRLRESIPYPIQGTNEVEKGMPKYFAPGVPGLNPRDDVKTGRVYISKYDSIRQKDGQYFAGVTPEVWNHHIGGYQVCEKWLKDRRGRNLTLDDCDHYRKVVRAIERTIELMRDVDIAIEDAGGFPIE